MGSFYAEFLSPLIGSEYDRDGNRRATTRVAGVTSQNLRYDRRSRAKDILYLHDTIELLGGSLSVLREEWNRMRQEFSHGAIRIVERAVDTMFSKMTDDIRGAAQAAAGRGLTPQAVQELCRAGLKIVFAAESADIRK